MAEIDQTKYHELLARVDERTKNIEMTLSAFRQDLKREIDDMNTKSNRIENDLLIEIKAIRKDMAENYVTKDSFQPIRILVYGFTAILLTRPNHGPDSPRH